MEVDTVFFSVNGYLEAQVVFEQSEVSALEDAVEREQQRLGKLHSWETEDGVRLDIRLLQIRLDSARARATRAADLSARYRDALAALSGIAIPTPPAA